MTQRNDPNVLSSYKTTITTTNGVTNVTYQDTLIVRFNEDHIILDTGGHQSLTTKKKMNQAAQQFGLCFSVYQKDFTWYVEHKGATKTFNGDVVYLSRRGAAESPEDAAWLAAMTNEKNNIASHFDFETGKVFTTEG